MDFIRRFLGLSKEENELKDAQVFNSCVVDYANIYSLDLTDSFTRIRNLSNNHDLDFSIVVNIKRKEFFDRLDAISLVLRFRPSDIEEFIQKHLIKASDVDEVVDEIFSKIPDLTYKVDMIYNFLSFTLLDKSGIQAIGKEVSYGFV